MVRNGQQWETEGVAQKMGQEETEDTGKNYKEFRRNKEGASHSLSLGATGTFAPLSL